MLQDDKRKKGDKIKIEEGGNFDAQHKRRLIGNVFNKYTSCVLFLPCGGGWGRWVGKGGDGRRGCWWGEGPGRGERERK